jgi:hypothetical protein
MVKLGYETKGDFQSCYFGELVKKYFEGGNARNSKSVAYDIEQIMDGLSRAYDKAEENTPDTN